MSGMAPTSTQEAITFLSDGLRLEGILSYPDVPGSLDVAVLVPPHPCLGGDMENNVILALDSALRSRGAATLRFNFRGVGRSESRIPLEQQISAFWENPRIDPEHETGLVDLCAATECALRAIGGCCRLSLVGYSFGGVLTLLLAAGRRDVAGVAAISPPVHQLAGEPSWPRGARTVITRGGDDIGIDSDAHARLLDALGPPVVSLVFEETDHFYRDLEATLAERVVSALLDER